MPANPERIYEVCHALLAAVSTRHGGTLPDRQYVAAGPPAFDCQLLSVHCLSTAGYDGNLGSLTPEAIRRGAGFAMRSGQFGITIVRCTPAVPDSKGAKVSLPTVAQEEEAAELLYTDAGRVLNALVAAAKASELTGCHSIAFEGWSVIGPDGGMVAGELLVRVGLVMGV